MLAALLLATATATSAKPAPTCPPMSLAALEGSLKGKGETKVVFFASWCATCKDSLEKSYPDGTVFVAAFDERDAAEAVASRYKLAHVCYTDEGSIAKGLGVTGLPAVKDVRF